MVGELLMLRASRAGIVWLALAGPVARAQQPATEAPPPIADDHPEDPLSTGALGVIRIDGKGRGFAGGVGLAISGARLEAEILVLKSEATGGYLGARYRLRAGTLRPYGALGMPGFVYDQPETSSMSTTKKLAVGVRAAIGIELALNAHVSVHCDLGWEHFFNVSDTRYDANLFVPTLGVIGRL